MAIMIPGNPPSKKACTQSEREFWHRLKEGLSDEFYIYHGLPYLRSNGVQGELDFLVVHRMYGVLNIEVKGRGVGRNEYGRWYRIDEYGRQETMDKTPAEQARGQIEHIVEGLKDAWKRALPEKSFKKCPVVYGWAMAFPKGRLGENGLPLELERQVVIDSSDVQGRRLEEKVVGALRFHEQKLKGDDRRLSAEEFGAFRSVICPPVAISGHVRGADLDEERRQLLELSERQTRMVRQILANPRVRVTGGAGTGKTVLALHSARLLAEDGEDVLVTCFNAGLAEFLKGVVAQWGPLKGRVDVHHFHDLCMLANEDLGEVLDFSKANHDEKAVRDEFWRDDTAFVLMRAIDEGVFRYNPWDTIMVDEAQDFAATWWEALNDCMGDEEAGRRITFYDEEQAIFGRKPCIPEEGFVFPLFENFRNTRAISEALVQLVDREILPHPGVPDGEKPSVYQQPGPSKTSRMVTELIDDLVDKDRIDYGSIAILSPRSPQNSSLDGATKLGRHQVVHKVEQWGDGVLHSTISSFKGLEADVVILVDVDPESPRCSRNARYVAASRARLRLYVFEKGHWLKR